MIKKILVPVDGSPPSVRAVELASDLASKYNAEIVLLHVLLRGHMPNGLKKAVDIEIGSKRKSADNLVNIPQEIMARVDSRDGSQLSLEALDFIGKHVLSNVEELCREKGVGSITKHVEEGNPAKVIVDVAKRAKADMIVMGRSGLSELKGMLVGSVSNKVLHLADCTCVTVR
ncbi:MAG: universal stress protein [Fimbriimonadaceae bacterium]|nr:universal stress protein [Alphaproteobacteria bacterium]